MKRIVGSVLVVAATGFWGACGGDSASGATDGGGGTSGSGEGRNVYGECPASETSSGTTCTGEDEYDACIMETCAAELEACLGPAYASGTYSGACGDTLGCVQDCDCGDSTCELTCYAAASDACMSCGSDVDACIEQSGCPEPQCETSGTGGTDSGTGGTDSGTGGTDSGTGGTDPGGVCPYTSATLDCASACDNLAALAEACQDDPSLSADVQAMLALAAQGTGAGCNLACEADSPSAPGQWGCFQAVPPTDPCTSIAGCTVANCE